MVCFVKACNIFIAGSIKYRSQWRLKNKTAFWERTWSGQAAPGARAQPGTHIWAEQTSTAGLGRSAQPGTAGRWEREQRAAWRPRAGEAAAGPSGQSVGSREADPGFQGMKLAPLKLQIELPSDFSISGNTRKFHTISNTVKFEHANKILPSTGVYWQIKKSQTLMQA